MTWARKPTFFAVDQNFVILQDTKASILNACNCSTNKLVVSRRHKCFGNAMFDEAVEMTSLRLSYIIFSTQMNLTHLCGA